MSTDYIWYDKCECGGEFKGRSGVTFDCMPASYPVKCKNCGYEGTSQLREETDYMKWGKPKWERDER